MSYFYFCPNHPEEGACREQPFGENDGDNRCPECGKKFVMPYFYDICPWCMDELIERDQLVEGVYSDRVCPKCGRKLEKALIGAQKIYNYYISVNGKKKSKRYYSDDLLKLK